MTTTYRRLWLPDLLILIGVASIATVIFLKTPLDIEIEGYFYGASSSKTTWFLAKRFPWKQLYYYASVPAALVAAASIVALILGYIKDKYAKYRLYSIFLILSLVIGPGLLVNLAFKNYWGRPRPVEIKAFGGTWDYQQVLQKGKGGRGKSFPSGHASVGYYFLAFYFIFRRRKRALAHLSIALAYGTLIGVARMSMGGHFLSDVLWSAFIVFFSQWALYYFILKIPEKEDAAIRAQSTPLGLRTRAFAILSYCVIAIVITLGILLTTPVFKEVTHKVDVAYVLPYNVSIKCSQCNVDISLVNQGVLTITGTVQGAGLPNNIIEESLTVGLRFLLSEFRYEFKPHGIYSELTANINFIIGSNANTVFALSVDVEDGDIIIREPGPDATVPENIYIKLKDRELVLPESFRNKAINLSAAKESVSYR
ncbi:MAG: phosphatase PAP2 family protein [Nitrospirae bacterium]|nr:phosphatase PAP2 family protein [Nitrospirota bacterium]